MDSWTQANKHEPIYTFSVHVSIKEWASVLSAVGEQQRSLALLLARFVRPVEGVAVGKAEVAVTIFHAIQKIAWYIFVI